MPDAIARLNEALEDRYRIERELGEGGMAMVYLADDLKHERKVALKVLKPELAAVVGAERFLAEIKTTANLQHPHVLPLYDSGEANGLLFYVMPYVRGESLRDRLDREHQLPVDDAVRIATNMAEALDYAHREGVIHRDIKPANVLLQDGKPVIADFGIALAVGVARGGRLTETGLSIGTPHYMSPEQATGDQNVGPATDIYALGCVLYEMLVGEPPFTGSTPQAVLGKIITGEVPSARATRASVPPNVDAVIAKALEKVPADRFIAAAHLAAGLSETGFRHGGAPIIRDRRSRPALTLAALIVGCAFGVVVTREVAPRGPNEQLLPRTVVMPGMASDHRIMTDFEMGRAGFVYNGGSLDREAERRYRRWDELSSRTVEGSVCCGSNMISPDGTELAEVVDGALRIVPLEGGPVLTLAEDSVAGFVRWGADGHIYFQGFDRTPYRLSRDGSTPRTWVGLSLADGETSLHIEAVTRTGAMAVLQASGDDEVVYAVDLETGQRRRLADGTMAWLMRAGYLVVGLNGQLSAAPIDLESLELRSALRPVVDGIMQLGNGRPMARISDDGTLGIGFGPRPMRLWFGPIGRDHGA